MTWAVGEDVAFGARRESRLFGAEGGAGINGLGDEGRRNGLRGGEEVSIIGAEGGRNDF